MSNYYGPNAGHVVYELSDGTIYFVQAGTGPTPWLSPKYHATSNAAEWFAQAQPVLTWTSPRLPRAAALWVAQQRRRELAAAGLTAVLPRGYGRAGPGPKRAGESIRSIARRLGISRRAAAKYADSHGFTGIDDSSDSDDFAGFNDSEAA